MKHLFFRHYWWIGVVVAGLLIYWIHADGKDLSMTVCPAGAPTLMPTLYPSGLKRPSNSARSKYFRKGAGVRLLYLDYLENIRGLV